MTAPCRLAALGLATEGAVRMAPLLGLPRLLEGHGLDADAVIREQGCDPGLFADPDNTIRFSALGRLLAQTATVTRCAYPGMALNRHWGLDALGAVGRAVRLAPDVGTALRAIIVNLHLHDRGAVPYLWTDDHRAMFGYTLYCSDVVGTDHIYDGALTIAYNMLTELAGPGWKATEVRLFREPPADTAPFRAHFQAPLHFGAEQAAIVFAASDLERPLASADSGRYVAALRHLNAMGAISDNGLAGKVRRVLLRLLATGVIGTCAVPDRAMIAQLFALHPRTLNRRLRAEGTTFAAVLAQARYDIARNLLRDTRLPVQDIARILGYAAVGPFIHAFRHWSGTTPSAWRALHG